MSEPLLSAAGRGRISMQLFSVAAIAARHVEQHPQASRANNEASHGRYLRATRRNPLFLCGQALDVLRDLPSQSVDCCMTSPPYWGHRRYAATGIGQESDFREYVFNLAAICKEVRELGLDVLDKDTDSEKPFGMNWKMTAKTILVQLHHKVDTLEHIGKRLVLVIQDCLLAYLRSEFNFVHLKDVRVGDTMHIHSYKLEEANGEFTVQLDSRVSTDAAGVAECLGIQAETKIELETIVAELERKISTKTLLTLDAPMPLSEAMPTE